MPLRDISKRRTPKARVTSGPTRGTPFTVPDEYRYPNRGSVITSGTKKNRKVPKVMTSEPLRIERVADQWSSAPLPDPTRQVLPDKFGGPGNISKHGVPHRS